MTEQIKDQILIIRDTGLTNMFDVRTVKEIALDMGFDELFIFIDQHRGKYVHYILTGLD